MEKYKIEWNCSELLKNWYKKSQCYHNVEYIDHPKLNYLIKYSGDFLGEGKRGDGIQEKKFQHVLFQLLSLPPPPQ